MECGHPTSRFFLGITEIQPSNLCDILVHAVYHPVIDPREFSDRDTLMAVVRDSIASALPAERR